MSFSDKETPGGNRPKLADMTGHIRSMRNAASDVIQALTENTAAECEADQKKLKSCLKMGQRFDVTEEAAILAEAMAVWRSSRYVDNTFIPPKDLGTFVPAREGSVGDELREMEGHAKALAIAVRTCRQEVRECREEAEGQDVKRLRHCSEVLKDVADSSKQIAQSLDAVQEIVNFRRDVRPRAGADAQATEHASGRPGKPTTGRSQGV